MKHLRLADYQEIEWYVFGRDETKSEKVIDTNEYLIVCDGEGFLLDPGGTEIFPHVVNAVSEVIDLEKITRFFCSHQDPDIMSSLPLWMGLCPNASVHLPWMWSGFIAHFGHEYVDRFDPIPDEGKTIEIGKHHRKFQFVPAHYCHSSGNFSVYDPNCQVLFSGDIGAALPPSDNYPLIVENFQHHTGFMETFHRRWMPSNRAKNNWIERIRELKVDFLCPQHGSIFQKDEVKKFLDWFQELQVGGAV